MMAEVAEGRAGKPTVMVLGAGRAIVKSVDALKGAGFRCLVVDDLPQPFAFDVADIAARCAIGDVDGLEAVITDAGGVDGAVATNEAGVLAIAELRERGRLARGPTLEVAARLASKLQQRQTINARCAQWCVPFLVVREVADVIAAGEALGWPLILKPDLSAGGSRGVSLVADPADAATAFAFAVDEANGAAVLAEQALDGPQFSAEVLVAKGRAEVIAIGRKRKSRAPYRVDLAVIYPGLTGDAREAAERMLKDVVLALGIDESPAHVEFAMTAGGPRPIEVGGRVGGGFTALLAGHASGCDPFEQAARVACGLPVTWPREDLTARGAVYGFLAYPPGSAVTYDIPQRLRDDPRVLDVFVFLPADGVIRPLRWTSQRSGMIAVTGDSAEDALAYADAIAATVTVTYADGERRSPLLDAAE